MIHCKKLYKKKKKKVPEYNYIYIYNLEILLKKILAM